MSEDERRAEPTGDRRAVPRGGRRPYDRPGRFPNLLVADSYEGARVPCARYLDHFGFRVEEAVDGREALSILSVLHPHVVLTELTLPAVSAAGICEFLDREPQTRSVPVIVLHSDFDADQAAERSPRASAILVKPFPLSAMLEQVRRALRAHPPLPC
jgi:CheY-like chemotaxis protein